MLHRKTMALALFAAIGSTSSWADNLLTETVLPLSLAQKAAEKAVQVCQSKGYNVSATVVDHSGYTRIQLRADHASVHTLDSSRKKAFTAASLGRSTAAVTEAIAKNAALEGLRDMNDNLIFLPGGEPIKFQNHVIAGIGVGGAPSGAIDRDCALAGIAAIAPDLK